MSRPADSIAAHYRALNKRNEEVSGRVDSQWTKDRIASIIAEREAISALAVAWRERNEHDEGSPELAGPHPLVHRIAAPNERANIPNLRRPHPNGIGNP